MSGYAKDRPADCRYCYYWSRNAPHCTYGNGRCFYSLPDPAKSKRSLKSECEDCPYGRCSPCIRWCTREILRSIKGGGRK